jgi:LmbE family N-acetylglucosaminyl deacetylase
VSGTPTVDLPPPGRALAIGAHPDDVEFGCGATLAKWAAAGTEVHLCVLTDGSKGTWELDADLATLVTRRREEAERAAARLGAEAVHALGWPDGELGSGLIEREAVCRVIRAVRPEVLLGHDPWRRYRLHPDHRHAGWLTVDALVAARDPHFFPAAGAHHRVRHLLLFEADEPDHIETVDAAFGRKLAALLEHRSQWRTTLGIDPADPGGRARFEARLRDEARATAGRFGHHGLVEAFRHLTGD